MIDQVLTGQIEDLTGVRWNLEAMFWSGRIGSVVAVDCSGADIDHRL